MQLPDAESAEPELFGTETMAELCARQGRLAEAIRIFQRLLEQSPPADKAERWAERCRSLERARAHVPDLVLPEPTRPPARRETRPRAEKPIAGVAAVALPPAAAPDFDLGSEITAVTALEVTAVHSMDVTAVRSLESLARRTAVDGDYAEVQASEGPARPPHAYLPAETPHDALDPAAPAATASPVETEEQEVPEAVEAPHRLPLIITQPVRSGQVFYAAKNDLIVLGSVNSGGQVVADGNIHIYGALRGRAIAGAQGARDARIFCQKLEAELLAISGIYLIWDDIPRAHLGKPAQISLRDDVCEVSSL